MTCLDKYYWKLKTRKLTNWYVDFRNKSVSMNKEK